MPPNCRGFPRTLPGCAPWPGKDLGFGTRMLAEAAPAFSQLRRLSNEQWSQVQAWWSELTPWRTPDSPWLALALHVTVTDPKEIPR